MGRRLRSRRDDVWLTIRHVVHYVHKREKDVMTTISIAKARDNLADAVNRVNYGGERVILARRGKPVAALVSPEDLSFLQRIEDAEDIRAAVKVLKEYERKPSAFAALAEYKRDRRARA